MNESTSKRTIAYSVSCFLGLLKLIDIRVNFLNIFFNIKFDFWGFYSAKIEYLI